MKKPELRDVQNYFYERTKNYSLSKFEGEKFFDYYSMVGWVVGKNKQMKAWKFAVHQWLRTMEGNTTSRLKTTIVKAPTNDIQEEINRIKEGYNRLKK